MAKAAPKLPRGVKFHSSTSPEHSSVHADGVPSAVPTRQAVPNYDPAPTGMFGSFRKKLERLVITFDRGGTATAAPGRPNLLSKLDALRETVSAPDWDGEGAEAVAPETFRLARSFANQLPVDIADPDDVDATPQGQLEFAWEGRNGQDVFGVQVLPSGELAMSGMFGRMRLYGNVEWDRKSLPGFVRSGLAWIRSPTGK